MSKAPRRPERADKPGPARPTRPTTGSRPASHGAAGTPRAGRREQRRPRYDDRSFLERHRGAIITGAAVTLVALVVAFVFAGATAKTYACTNLWEPEPTPTPAAGASPRAGYLQPEMGRNHVRVSGDQTRYTYCPPASGNHYAQSGVGPIQPRFYSPDDLALPGGWIHNLEHGGLVVLYGCSAGGSCDEATLDKLRDFVASVPPSPICGTPAGTHGPVVARFDDMAWPFAALLWGRVLPLETLDTDAILEFYRIEGDRYNPENRCPPPSPSPEPAPSESPAASPAASPSESPAASPSESPADSPSPSPSPS